MPDSKKNDPRDLAAGPELTPSLTRLKTLFAV